MKAPILAALVVLSALVAPAAAIQNTTNDKLVVQEFEQRQDSDGNVEFGSGLFTVTNGNVAELEIEFTDTSEATVIIGDENEVNYKLVTTVTDENGDGTATLLFDTTKLHTTEQTVEIADEGDSLTIEDELPLDRPLDSGDYPLAIEKDGELEHLSTLSVMSMMMDVTEDSEELDPAPNQVIEIDTRLNPGTVVDVRVQSRAGIENPLLESRTIKIQEDGTITLDLDLGGFENEVVLDVSVMYNGQVGEDAIVVVDDSSSPTQSDSNSDDDQDTPGFGAPFAAFAVILVTVLRQR